MFLKIFFKTTSLAMFICFDKWIKSVHGLILSDPSRVKLTHGNLIKPPFQKVSTLWCQVLWLLVFRHYARFLEKLGGVVLRLCHCTNVVPEPYPQLSKIQDISFEAIAGWIPSSEFMNLFGDTNKFGLVYFIWDIAQKMNFFIKDFYSKCDLVKLRIWSHLLKKSLMENFIFCTLRVVHQNDPKWWKTYMRTSVCLQRYFKNSFICIYLFIYLFIHFDSNVY